ncbi:hypothetical protein ACC675_37360, partial [Rhizobium ruizarguesonis]
DSAETHRDILYFEDGFIHRPASTGGLAGVFFAAQQGFVNPTSFTFFESALILAIVVLGGLGSTAGVI